MKDGYLTIHATKNENTKEKDKETQVIRRERSSGCCRRNFYVGDWVKKTEVKASFENGELKIIIPMNDIKQVEEKKVIPIE